MDHHQLAPLGALALQTDEATERMTDAAPDTLFLLRLSGELYIKSQRTRSHFFRRLLGNLKAALGQHGIAYRLEPTWSRLYLHTPEPASAGVEAIAARVFGIQSVSEVRRIAWDDLDGLVRAAVPQVAAQVEGKSFAVSARRRGGTQASSLASPDVERALGRALLDSGAARVDLTAPQVEVEIEYEPGLAHLALDRTPGPGGLPLGVEGRALALLSGGFDSAVAAWMMQKRGIQLDYLLCNLGGMAHRLGALRVAEILTERWSHGSSPRLWEVDFAPLAARLQRQVPADLRQVVLKRLMLRAGLEVARHRRPEPLALVTGDALGQVSSQTLHNLGVVSGALTELPILRPLLGANKEEIVALARRIGIFEAAAMAQEFCALGGERPSTRARLVDVERAEAVLGAVGPEPLAEALASLKAYPLRERPSLRLDLGSPEVDVVPPGATVLDLRPAAAFRAGHHPQALRLDFAAALAALPHLDRSLTYVVTCALGLQSAALAERMRAAGLDAYRLRPEPPASF